MGALQDHQEIGKQMFIDIFECFKKANKEIASALSYAYPENSLNAVCGHQAMHRIDGIARSLKIVMENKIESDKNQKEEEFRNVFEENEEREAQEQELEYVVNWNSILELYPEAIIGNVDFYKKNESNLHGCLQNITGQIKTMNLFLNAIVCSSE
jgi:hypothetical protein